MSPDGRDPQEEVYGDTYKPRRKRVAPDHKELVAELKKMRLKGNEDYCRHDGATITLGDKTIKLILALFASHHQAAIQEILGKLKTLKEEMKQHTVPEGYDLITRDYLYRSIDFLIKDLEGML